MNKTESSSGSHRRTAMKKIKILSDRTFWCRHELKYLISESTAAGVTQFITQFMRMDRFSELQENGTYPIVSLYLDSPNLKLFRESMDGHKNRFKLRIRSYTDDIDYPRFFEIKRRVNTIIIKSRAQVMDKSIPSFLSGKLPPPQGHSTEDEALKQFMFYLNSIRAKPMVQVRYQRQAYESKYDQKRVRITFDRDLCGNITSLPHVGLDGRKWYKVPTNGVILEVKFTGRYPGWIDRMVKCFGLNKRSISKYANCVNQSFLLGYCAPKRMVAGYVPGFSEALQNRRIKSPIIPRVTQKPLKLRPEKKSRSVESAG